ncbi:unnamed protein product [Protopolystoma xenopodis]|uniref:Uncharacterized protein n=1 Tax=Protopolystoma xenopodis TaxID=117903 RepID=A0A448WYQ0_9PLAT|nr:unnamed protein product [Protopolystoma xenopodis]
MRYHLKLRSAIHDPRGLESKAGLVAVVTIRAHHRLFTKPPETPLSYFFSTIDLRCSCDFSSVSSLPPNFSPESQ